MTPCREWQGTRKSGKHPYGIMWVRGSDGKRRWRRLHMIVWEMAHGPIPDGLVVRHLCGNPPCVRIDHLAVGTIADNSKDMIMHGNSTKGRPHPGTIAKGERLPQTKLTDSQVLDIYASTESQQTLAERYGVHQVTISKIKTGKNWSWLTQPQGVITS